MSEVAHAESSVEAAGLPIRLLRGGTGPSLLVLGHETGSPGWLPFHDALAASHDVIAPTLPGWDGSERGEWMRSVRDISTVMSLLLDALDVGECALVGLGFGGFVAAEMAAAGQSRFSGLALVGAMGLQPEEGEIRDQFLEAHEDYVRSCFADPANFQAVYGESPDTEQLIMWDANREMTARVAWKPFLYSQSLPQLLGSIRIPALVVHPSEDTVVPATCAEQYANALANAHLADLKSAGHIAEADQPTALAALITEHLG